MLLLEWVMGLADGFLNRRSQVRVLPGALAAKPSEPPENAVLGLQTALSCPVPDPVLLAVGGSEQHCPVADSGKPGGKEA